ncbi:thiol:disulfide interchange protein [Staphylococcus warneri]
MIGFVIAMLFCVSFIGSIASLSVFIVDLIVNKQLSKKGLLFFFLLGIILNILPILIYPIGIDNGVLKK